jgi:lipopolysaccharide/colanic/teichoic acid biosynthesis glycosyltransferase
MERTDLETTKSRNEIKPPEEKGTRRQKRKEKKQKKSEKIPARRIFPIWLRIITVFLLAFLALIVGLLVGFSLGDGNPMDVLEFEFWQGMIDFISGE